MLGAEAVAKSGRFTFPAFVVRIPPKSTANVTVSFQGMEHYGTPIEFLDSPPVFTVTARECIEGEQYTEDLSCLPCPPAFFLYEAPTKPGPCNDCHPNAHCYGMNNTAPKAGFWRSAPKLETYTLCTRPESCLGGNKTDPPVPELVYRRNSGHHKARTGASPTRVGGVDAGTEQNCYLGT